MTIIPNPPSAGEEFTNELTGVTYRYDGEKWLAVAAAGNEALEALTVRVSDGEIKQSQIEGTIATALDTQAEIQTDISTLEGKIETLETGDSDSVKKDEANEVTTDFRIRSAANKVFISTFNNQLGLYNLGNPTASHHAVNEGYVNSNYLKLAGGTMTGNVNLNSNKITNLDTPTSNNDAANKSYVDTKAGNYLPLNGGTMTGHITTPHNINMRGGRIDASHSSSSVLSGRGCLDIRSHADKPIIISSGSSYQPLLEFYHYDNSAPDNKAKIAGINANGNAYFNNVFVGADNKKLATEEFVGTSADGLATETYVDDAVTGLATEGYVDAAVAVQNRKYPGLRFKFGNATTIVTHQKFNYYQDGGLRLRLSTHCLDYKWLDGGLTVDYSLSEGHRFSIYEEQIDGSLKVIRTGTYNRIDYHASDCLLRVSSHQTNGSFNTTSIYHLVISGLF
jgi:hypothetical protein